MPEPPASGLRQLRALESRLKEAEAKAATEKRLSDTLRATLTKKEREIADAQEVIDRLVEENRMQAGRLADVESARDAALDAAEEKVRGRNDALDQLKQAIAEAKAWRHRVDALADKVQQLRVQIPADGEVASVVTGASLAHLIDEFVSRIEQQSSGIRLQEGSVRLQVGLAETGGEAAFVIPRAGPGRDEVGPLHEIVMSFERGLRAGDEEALLDLPDSALEE